MSLRFSESHQEESIISNNNTSNSTKTCIICCCEFIFGISTLCNHDQICAICAMKMRYLMGDFQCPCCRSNWNTVIIRMYFDDPNTKEYFRLLRAFRCIECEKSISTSITSSNNLNNFKFSNLQSLSLHLEKAHMKYLCKVCVTELKVLPYQLRTYSSIELKYHKKDGDPAKGSLLAIEPHPLCQFCNQLFFNKDTLFYHLSKDHFSCHICDEIQQSQTQPKRVQNYFRNYHSLELHFRKKHFLCENSDCLALRYIVFSDELELKAHMFKKHMAYNAHNKKLPRSQIKKLSQLPIELSYGHNRIQSNYLHNRNNDQDQSRMTIRHDTNNENIIPSSEKIPNDSYENIDQLDSFREIIEPVWVPRQNLRFVNTLDTPSPNELHSPSNTNMISKQIKVQKPHISPDPNSWANILISGQSIKRNKPKIPPKNNFKNANMNDTCSIENFPLLTSNTKGKIKMNSNSNFISYSSVVNPQSQHKLPKKYIKSQSEFISSTSTNNNIVSRNQNIKNKALKEDKSVLLSGVKKRESDDKTSLTSNIDNTTNNNSNNLLNQYNYAKNNKEQENTVKSTEALSLPLIDMSRILPFSMPPKCSKSEISSSNRKLINGVKKSLNNNSSKYEQFKKMSMLFRHGTIDSVEYYNYFVTYFSHCQDIYNDCGENIGSYQLLQLLLYLLPDDNKREELFEVFKNDFLLTKK